MLNCVFAYPAFLCSFTIYATCHILGGELREDIPLKTGAKNARLCDCSEECMGGSKLINFAFGTLTLIITIALLIQIYYGDYQVSLQNYV